MDCALLLQIVTEIIMSRNSKCIIRNALFEITIGFANHAENLQTMLHLFFINMEIIQKSI